MTQQQVLPTSIQSWMNSDHLPRAKLCITWSGIEGNFPPLEAHPPSQQACQQLEWGAHKASPPPGSAPFAWYW
ncbi:unnamed protein product [Nesidiocoris tenuis]|uniref:Uncharacterized protein n=1 Tax=Nesidiocoris tenuis TaxID=355587 RepID=A0A6H5G9B8_9HEMI|nr:unnamed protein product [Nesidiocoris tenuis]